MLRFSRFLVLCAALAIACLVTAASTQAIHPRPKSASPIKTSLVPAYNQCGAPNRTHGPPLAFASCNPPAQTSAQATVGTPDAFGGGANSTGFLRLKQIMCQSNCPTEDTDILVDIAVSDVRCIPTGPRCGGANNAGPPDYSGELRFSFIFRITDHYNGSSGTEAATVQDFAREFAWVCVQSGSGTTGSTCNLSTSLEAIQPAAVPDGKRGVWELNAVRIFDGGADGDGDTAGDNTVFMRPGVFIP